MITKVHRKVLELVVNKLRENRILFQVSGGLAAIAYGAKQPLYDIDIDVHKKDISKIRRIFKTNIQDDYYHFQDENFDIWLITLNVHGIDVDISQVEDFFCIKGKNSKVKIDTYLSKANEVVIEGIRVPVQSKEELIEYKKILSREVDLADIRQIS